MATSSVQPTATSKFDQFIAAIKALPATEKERLSDEWSGHEGKPSHDPLLATFGSAVWYVLDLKKGQGFEDRVIKNLRIKKCATPRETALKFIDRYMPAPVLTPAQPKLADSITPMEYDYLDVVVNSEFHDGEEVVDHPVWAPLASDFTTIKKKQLGGVASSLQQKGFVNIYDDGSKPSHPGQQTITVAITGAGFEAYMRYKTEHLPAGTPTVEGLEERINDLAKEVKKGKVAKEVVAGSKKGRGYANEGKKYEHSGVRVETFKLGKKDVKKGDKLYFKIGQEVVCGIFSHLNKCVHCPEGYAVIKFNGKAYERRQTRISLTPEIA